MKGSVVAIGVFDGVHRGHVKILERAVRLARERGLECVVVSFDPHPDVVLAKTFRARPPLTPLPEKRTRLLALGVDRLDVLPFTRELAALEAEEFVDRHLVATHHPEALVVGENFALGRARTGDPARLAEIGKTRGFAVESVALEWVDGAPVSSTRVRALLDEGRVTAAASLLGRRYGLTGVVVAGDGIGRTLGVPTANLRLHEEKLVPANGIYAVWARLPGETESRPAAMSIGVRPTFGGQSRALEVHVLDWEGDLRGHDIDVELAHWLRPELRFDGPAELVAAMQEDLARTRRMLASEEAPAFRSTR
jgi:riboflavin kinase/FMN adenylyltransferase